MLNFANTFHPTIKFTCEMSSQRAVFLDTEVFKGPRLTTHKILDLQTHFKPTETFQYTHFSSCHPLNCKKGFIKGEALRLLRTNSVRENFVKNKRDFEHRLCKRGYPLTLVQEILTDVKFTDRKKALRNKTTQTKEILPFVTTYNPATPNLKKILMKHWHIIQQQPKLQKNLQPATDCIIQEGKIPQGHPCPRENSFNLTNNHKTNKAVKSKLEDNLHTITLTDS